MSLGYCWCPFTILLFIGTRPVRILCCHIPSVLPLTFHQLLYLIMQCSSTKLHQFVITVRFVAPELWEHVFKLHVSQSVNDSKGRSAAVNEGSLAGTLSTYMYACRAYMCLILFLTNNNCSSPLRVQLREYMYIV